MQHASLSTSLSKASLCLDRDPSAGWGVGRDLPYPRVRPHPPLLLPAPPAPSSAEAGQSSAAVPPINGATGSGRSSAAAAPSGKGGNGNDGSSSSRAGDGGPFAAGHDGGPFAAVAMQASPSTSTPDQVAWPGDHAGIAQQQQHGQAEEQQALHAEAQRPGFWAAHGSMTNESPFAQMRLRTPSVQPGCSDPASCTPPEAPGSGSASEAAGGRVSTGTQSRGAASSTAAARAAEGAAETAAAQAAPAGEESLSPAQLPTLSVPKQHPSAELLVEADGSRGGKALPAPCSPRHVLAVPVSRGTTVDEGGSLGAALDGLHLAGQGASSCNR